VTDPTVLYAAQLGRVPGDYTSWTEEQCQIGGVHNDVRKFYSGKKAEDLMVKEVSTFEDPLLTVAY